MRGKNKQTNKREKIKKPQTLRGLREEAGLGFSLTPTEGLNPSRPLPLSPR